MYVHKDNGIHTDIKKHVLNNNNDEVEDRNDNTIAY